MASRRHHLRDDGLASIADVATRPTCYSVFPRRGGSRIVSSFDEKLPRQPHFLEACYLCGKPIGGNKDIYMYRGDTPFCSEECRQEQIEMDEAKENEKKWKLSKKSSSLRKNQKKSNSSSPNKAQGYPLRAGAVAAG